VSINTEFERAARIKVVGVGGGGSNAVSRMFRDPIPGVEYIVVNTDAQALVGSDVPMKVRIGDQLTGGKGVGGNPELGKSSAEESREELYETVRDADMVFVAAGMGGGTGTGSAPVVAQIARETEALTVGIVTRPFEFEGLRRARVADEGISRLKDAVDTLLVIPNERLHAICDEEITTENAFKMADDVLRLGVQSIAELVTTAGEINVDFADVHAIMRDAGPAWMSIGWGMRAPRQGRRTAGDHQPAAGRLHRGSPGCPFQHHGRQRPQALGASRGGRGHPASGRPRRQHHLRNGHRPEDGERDQADDHRDRVPDHRDAPGA